MKCDKCDNKLVKKISYDPVTGWSCDFCGSKPKTQNGIGVKVMHGNKHYAKQSEAMFKHVNTRKVRSDGKIHPDKRWA